MEIAPQLALAWHATRLRLMLRFRSVYWPCHRPGVACRAVEALAAAEAVPLAEVSRSFSAVQRS
eukprot:6187537-Pleurochrysis_carterae.AAC.1